MEKLNVGRNIRRLRESAGMSQEGLAEILGIDRSAVAQWETGRTNPRLADLPAIAAALGCEIDELLRTQTQEGGASA